VVVKGGTTNHSGAKLPAYSRTLLGTLVSGRPVGCAVRHGKQGYLSKIQENYPLDNYYNDKQSF